MHLNPAQQIRCVGSALEAHRPTMQRKQSPIVDLCVQIASRPIELKERQQSALGSVIPLLICGEQSAITVFNDASQHGSPVARSLHHVFSSIEADEIVHEAAWQTLFAQLPDPQNLRQLKRRAALFFARLGRSPSIAEHFAQIAHLDSAVGTIMWHLERSDVARDKRIADLAREVKQDEARHVAVSRHYAFAAGIERARYADLGEKVRSSLIALLTPNADAIEGIGIDPAALFKRIDKKECR